MVQVAAENLIICVAIILNCMETLVEGHGYHVDYKVNQLRSAVLEKIPKSSYIQVFAKDDLYLMKWLEANSMDVNKAESKLMQHSEWRLKERIDEKLGDSDDASWPLFRNEFVVVTGHKDRSGRPLAEMWVGDWNIRQAIISGLKNKLRVWVSRNVDKVQKQLYEARAKGENVTHAALLLDMEGFNLFTIGCGQCIQFFAMWALDFETHYPGLYSNVYMVNVTPGANLLIAALKSVVRTGTMNSILQFTERRIWIPKLDSVIDPSQRSYKLGGLLRN